MKLRITLLSLSLVLSSTALFGEEDTPLEKQMQILARGMKQLSVQISDPSKNQDSVALIESLKQAAGISKELKPRKTASIPQADQEQFLTAYKAQIAKLSDAFSQIEEAIKAGKNDQAKTVLATICPIKKEGHSKFKQD
jgi:soluble cytochrome b562